MTQVWKKVMRSMRTKTGVTVLAILIILALVMHNLAAKPVDQVTNKNPILAPPSAALDPALNTNVKEQSTEKIKTQKEVYTLPLVNGMHVNPYPFTFTMTPKACTDEELVVVVHSAVQYFERRAVMRSTWLNMRNLEDNLGLKTRIVFITGGTEDESVQHHVNYEQEMYDDMVQSDFLDSYQNNTYKAISFLKWVSGDGGCPNASIVMKVDDDALTHPLNLPQLNKTIQRAIKSNSSDVYLGRLLSRAVNRRADSKWGVSWELWPHELYPVWFQGLAYLITPQLAAKLPAIALDVKYMFTDDVYVGVLVSQVEGVNVISDEKFGLHTEGSLDKFFQAFKKHKRIFYHVPSIKHFISWYYYKDDPSISKDDILLQAAKKTPLTSSSSIPGTIIIFVLIIPFLIALFICRYNHVECTD